MHPLLAWSILILGWALPLAHVLVSRTAGPWRPPPGARCPIGPRPGWIIMILVLGPIGYLLFLRSRKRLHA
jgi:hypothetical protein